MDKAVPEALACHELLVAERIQILPTRYRRWIGQLSLGQLEAAEADRSWLFPDHLGTDAEAAGLLRAAEILVAWSQGYEPCEARRQPFEIAAAASPEELEALARQILEPATALTIADDFYREEIEQLLSELSA